MKNNTLKNKTVISVSFFAAIILILLCIYFFSTINKVSSKSFKKDEGQDIKVVDHVPKSYLNWGMKSINYNNDLNFNKHANIKVALLDSGVNDHQDLKGVVKETKNFTKSDNDDHLNHGIPIAGILAANNKLKRILDDIDLYNANIVNEIMQVSKKRAL